LEPVKVVLDGIFLLPFFQLGLLLLRFFETSRPRTPTACDGDEAFFVGDGARELAVLVAQGLESIELREVGVDAGLEGGGSGIGEVGVLAVA
jgi:hypothetical protein